MSYEDPDQLGTYLKDAAQDRVRTGAWARAGTLIATLGLAVALVALVLVCVVIVNQHNNLVAGCERAHVRDSEMARRALSDGAREDRESALARASADCGAQYSLLP